MPSGADVLAAQAIGADLAYIGTRFIATQEANAISEYKEMLVDSMAKDIVYSSTMDISKSDQADAQAWKDIWGAGQGVGSIHEIMTARSLVMRMEDEYRVRASELAI